MCNWQQIPENLNRFSSCHISDVMCLKLNNKIVIQNCFWKKFTNNQVVVASLTIVKCRIFLFHIISSYLIHFILYNINLYSTHSLTKKRIYLIFLFSLFLYRIHINMASSDIFLYAVTIIGLKCIAFKATFGLFMYTACTNTLFPICIQLSATAYKYHIQ